MHIGIEIVDWPILGIGLLASAFFASGSGYWTSGVGNDCFYAAAAISIVVDSWGLHKSGGCLHILYFCIFLFLFFHHTKNYNKHNNVVVTTFKLVETYQALFLGGNGDDSRRRKPHGQIGQIGHIQAFLMPWKWMTTITTLIIQRDGCGVRKDWVLLMKTRRSSGEHFFRMEGVLLLYALNMLRIVYKS